VLPALFFRFYFSPCVSRVVFLMLQRLLASCGRAMPPGWRYSDEPLSPRDVAVSIEGNLRRADAAARTGDRLAAAWAIALRSVRRFRELLPDSPPSKTHSLLLTFCSSFRLACLGLLPPALDRQALEHLAQVAHAYVDVSGDLDKRIEAIGPLHAYPTREDLGQAMRQQRLDPHHLHVHATVATVLGLLEVLKDCPRQAEGFFVYAAKTLAVGMHGLPNLDSPPAKVMAVMLNISVRMLLANYASLRGDPDALARLLHMSRLVWKTMDRLGARDDPLLEPLVYMASSVECTSEERAACAADAIQEFLAREGQQPLVMACLHAAAARLPGGAAEAQTALRRMLPRHDAGPLAWLPRAVRRMLLGKPPRTCAGCGRKVLYMFACPSVPLPSVCSTACHARRLGALRRRSA
jgi:hypothetical protein